ncbi:MAG: family 43 glycosylhydrolase [Bacteroidota bacterium]
MKKVCAIIILQFILNIVFAQNPIAPPGVYIADPSAHQWKDGKMYVYGSRDESPKYYCSRRYDVLSSADLKTWTLHENSFASKGPNDQVSYSDNFLYAPDCQYRDGTYYLYYCLASGRQTEGVATSTKPEGPFVNGTDIKVYGRNQIDPAVFIDDDGQAYYVWGQFNAKMAKMKPNMKEIDSASIKENIVTEKEHFFHEGSFLAKRNGIYYLVYAHMGRAGRPTCLGYATSKSPMGPYKYGGVIIDNDKSDPNVWNNHGSIVEFNKKWYVFYHRPTHGSETMRKACLEPIEFNEDGSINEVEMTTQGAAGPLNPTVSMDAERACLLYGNVRITAFAADNEELDGIKNGDAVAYKYLSFDSTDSLSSFIATVAPGAKSGRIDIVLDDFWGPSIGRLDVPGNGDLKTWTELTARIRKPKGVHALWLRFSGAGEDIFRVDKFRFR